MAHFLRKNFLGQIEVPGRFSIMKCCRHKNQKGFTLLELIIVVAILGVIIAIAVPQYNSYRTRAQTASVMSNCRSLYRAFTVFYLENEYAYPSAPGDGNTDDMDLDTFFPLKDPAWLGGLNFEIDINQLKRSIGGNPADRNYASPDGNYQQYFLVIPWGADPGTLFIVASSDQVEDKAGNSIDGGNWLDGVFMWKNGELKYQ
jgi:prepilin-type N-terminal cleavage/methylation domain-containing protein